MNGAGKSDRPIVPGKPANKDGSRRRRRGYGEPYTGTQAETPDTAKGEPTVTPAGSNRAAERVEGRGLAKGNPRQQNAPPCQQAHIECVQRIVLAAPRADDPVPEVGSWLRSVVGGHLRYYGVPMNSHALSLFRFRVGWLWARSMRRRSQKTRLTWERMSRLIDHWSPPPRVCHPYPLYRLGVIPEAGARCGSPTLGAQGALAVSRRRGSGTVAAGGKGAGGPHAGSAMDRAGTTDSYGGGEGDGVRGVAYGAISRGG